MNNTMLKMTTAMKQSQV